MFKRISMLAVAGLVFMVATEDATQAHGFGGYHGVGGVHVGPAGGVRVGGVGGVRVGGVGGVRVGGVGGVYGRGVGGYRYGGYGRAFPYGSYGDAYGNVYLPPKPGKGPAGISAIGSGNNSDNNLAVARKPL